MALTPLKTVTVDVEEVVRRLTQVVDTGDVDDEVRALAAGIMRAVCERENDAATLTLAVACALATAIAGAPLPMRDQIGALVLDGVRAQVRTLGHLVDRQFPPAMRSEQKEH